MSKRHYTAISSQDGEPLNRYSFLERASTACVYFNKTGKIVEQIPFSEENNGLFSVKYNQDNTKIIASFGSGAIETYNAHLGCLECVVKAGDTKSPKPIMCVRCVPCERNTFFAASSDGCIYACRCQQNGYIKFSEERQNEIQSIDISSNGNHMASGGKDLAVRLYDINNEKLVSKFYRPGPNDTSSTAQFHTMRIFAVRFHPTDVHTFLTGGWDDNVKMWDTRVKDSCVRNIIGPHICGDALDLKNREVLTGSWVYENGVQLWDLGSGRLIDTITPKNRVQTIQGDFWYCCQFLKSEVTSNVVICGGSGTGDLEILNVKEHKLVNTFKAHKAIQAIDSNVMSNTVFGGMENIISIAKI